MSQESIFSKEKSERCDLPVVPPIPDVPEIVECEMGPVPVVMPPVTDLPPVDGCDAIDGIDGEDGIDGQDGEDGCDAINGIDGEDGIDGQDGEDGCDAINGMDGEDGIDGQDGEDGCDAVDGTDGQDGIDGQDGEDGCDAIDGIDGEDGIDGQDGEDGIANFFESHLTENYRNGAPLAYIHDRQPVRVPYPGSQCDLPAGTLIRFYADPEQTYVLGNEETHFVLLDAEVNCGGDGGLTMIVSGDELICEIIEPVRSPRFYDETITPNPMAVGLDGFFCPKTSCLSTIA